MSKLAHVPEAMQKVLKQEANYAGSISGFVERQSKLTAELFVQTIVFGWMNNPAASLEELTSMAALLGVEITAQGLDARFNEEAPFCLKRVLDASVSQVISSSPVSLELLNRFCGVYLEDAGTVGLPDDLAQAWIGCGSQKGQKSSVKLEVRLDFCSGHLGGPYLMDGYKHEARAALSKLQLPANSLWLVDLGYFGLERMEKISSQGAYFLIKTRSRLAIVDMDGKQWELGAFLRSQKSDRIDVRVKLGVRKKFACRLIAMRAPKEAVAKRRARLREDARCRCTKPTKQALAVAEWTVYVTNVREEKLTVEEALILARTRWQIELLFKLWKSHGQIDNSRSKKSNRRLCEFYAKLIGMVIEHWILIVSCWSYPERSLMKAAKVVQKHVLFLAVALNCVSRLSVAIDEIKRCIAAGCKVNKRRKNPSNVQLLLAKSLA